MTSQVGVVTRSPGDVLSSNKHCDWSVASRECIENFIIFAACGGGGGGGEGRGGGGGGRKE